MHGLRRPVLPPGLPAGQPHPRVERPRLARSLAPGDRTATRHEQLPGIHRGAVSRSMRGRVRAGDQHRPSHDQAGRAADHRPRLGPRVGDTAPAEDADGSNGHRRRLRTSRARRRPAAHPGRPRRGRLRTGRPDRRTAALRHPRVQDAEAPARPAPPADEGRRHDLPGRSGGRQRPRRRTAPLPVRRRGPGRRRHRPAGATRNRSRTRRYPPGDGVSDLGKPGARRRPGRVPDHRRGPRRRHHRRGRHRNRLPGHRPPAGSPIGGTPRHPATPTRAAHPGHAVADLPGHLSDVPRPRGGRRTPVLRGHPRVPR